MSAVALPEVPISCAICRVNVPPPPWEVDHGVWVCANCHEFYWNSAWRHPRAPRLERIEGRPPILVVPGECPEPFRWWHDATAATLRRIVFRLAGDPAERDDLLRRYADHLVPPTPPPAPVNEVPALTWDGGELLAGEGNERVPVGRVERLWRTNAAGRSLPVWEAFCYPAKSANAFANERSAREWVLAVANRHFRDRRPDPPGRIPR